MTEDLRTWRTKKPTKKPTRMRRDHGQDNNGNCDFKETVETKI
ncbi:MAG: hypothetical protein ACI9G1_005471 [Pirellulaceae bacterium]|jgi:hypothetical protein